ncbi:16S rRNA (guanine(966)-N(2))-methyltransferase RsmD [Oleiagrimonas sp. C23AA]|uniref:16S rRNA (guanine(966)-N(2))-methyltransferase RsmD n=1 Tax=Oleiagrimonas sp. C23AA TaxID=2719047 RepID=UPI0014213B28|nr:16S rRNA (guanine(966)-N(2))-methyltransferase RsmD [Oleiagrimonas sp. C23AA]NII11560.1 16S rRNA (guanine(966)-N(2))-methyltransferase RsmD [Oleiagrimonas sp. C23AA]
MPRRIPPAPGHVRVSGGQLRGSKLHVPDLPGLRPTPSRIRETLFNWLQADIAGTRVLDLFAGSGALGIESLSRGAGEVWLVERAARAARAIKDNLDRLKQANARVHCVDAGALLATPPAEPFGGVFLDPPFALDLWTPVAAKLEAGGWLSEHAWIYVESPRDEVPMLPDNWQLARQGEAGQVRYALYRRSPSDPLS